MRSIECTFEQGRKEVAAVSAGTGCTGAGAVRGSQIRLTRRGRILVVLTVLVVLVVGFSMGRVSSQAASTAHRVTPPTVTVQPGESLWQLATRVAPHVDPRLVVDQIVDLNHLSSPQVFAGQQLVVPRAA